jgi:hypothetical protein
MRTPSFHIANGSLRSPMQSAAVIDEAAEARNELSIFGVWVPRIAFLIGAFSSGLPPLIRHAK